MAGNYFFDPRPFYGLSNYNLVPLDEFFYGRRESYPWVEPPRRQVHFEDYARSRSVEPRRPEHQQQNMYRDDTYIDNYRQHHEMRRPEPHHQFMQKDNTYMDYPQQYELRLSNGGKGQKSSNGQGFNGMQQQQPGLRSAMKHGNGPQRNQRGASSDDEDGGYNLYGSNKNRGGQDHHHGQKGNKQFNNVRFEDEDYDAPRSTTKKSSNNHSHGPQGQHYGGNNQFQGNQGQHYGGHNQFQGNQGQHYSHMDGPNSKSGQHHGGSKKNKGGSEYGGYGSDEENYGGFQGNFNNHGNSKSSQQHGGSKKTKGGFEYGGYGSEEDNYGGSHGNYNNNGNFKSSQQHGGSKKKNKGGSDYGGYSSEEENYRAPQGNYSNQGKSKGGQQFLGGMDGSKKNNQGFSGQGFNSNSKLGRSPAVELRVPICCDNCERRVRRALRHMEEVEQILCDQWSSKVTIVGNVRADKVLQKVRKVKKHAELWQQSKHGNSYGSLYF